MTKSKPQSTEKENSSDNTEISAFTLSTPVFLDAPFDDEATESPLIRKVRAMAKRAREPRNRGLDGLSTTDMKQMDMFVANLLDYNLKDDMATMEAPLFSLATKPDMETWKWISPDKKKWLEVTPSAVGRATIHDKDLLIYLTSQLVAAMNEASRHDLKMPGRRIRFTTHDFLVSTGRDTSGKAYKSIEAMIDRLSGTRLKTNIEIGNIDRRSSFGLIERADYIVETDSKGNQRTTSIEVTLSEWLYRAMEKRNILTITPDYFSLRRPLEKRIYELARKHVGDQLEWTIKEENLLDKSGSKAISREFRRMLKEIIAEDSIPDYKMEMIKSEKSNLIKFINKNPKRVNKASIRRINK